MTSAVVITDASHCPKTNAAGWAVWITIVDNNKIQEDYQASGNFEDRQQQAETAEMAAAWIGIWRAHSLGAEQIALYTDCMGIVRSAERRRQSKQALPCYDKVKWFHVSKHLEIYHDFIRLRHFWCDEQSRLCMKQERLLLDTKQRIADHVPRRK